MMYRLRISTSSLSGSPILIGASPSKTPGEIADAAVPLLDGAVADSGLDVRWQEPGGPLRGRVRLGSS